MKRLPHLYPKNTGDVRKRYDAFRNKPMTDLGDYAEFKSIIITNQDRKKIFGEDAVIDTHRKYEDPRKKEVELEIPFVKKQPVESIKELRPERYEPVKKKKSWSLISSLKKPKLNQQKPSIPLPKLTVYSIAFEPNDNPLTEPEYQYVKKERPVVETFEKQDFNDVKPQPKKPIFRKKKARINIQTQLYSQKSTVTKILNRNGY